ncbi:hypothetical protein [Hyphococcus sp.]|uniref:hypothetical protein n=1 Tax=Hyphococcus sp. TaxID=2038636 RepID=UPI00207EE4C4|nr:MAG: hypothetical protein DHS20C04_15750 [Marinicaulis sp.]
MTSASLHGKTARELQEQLAKEAQAPRRQRRNAPLSRAARLHLIDILSRWSGPGLALIAGVSIYLAIVAGRAYPGRAAAWALMMLGALWTCRRLRSQFRSGRRLTSRPFRWRASFTASLSVLGVILASAPILLAPTVAPAAFGVQILALSVIASFVTAILLAAHLPSAAALALPGAAFALLAGFRAADSGLLTAGLAASLLAVCGLFLANRILEKSAAARYPRMSLLRREVERRKTPSVGVETASSQAYGA